MRFSCHKAELLQAVQIASRVLPSQSTEPQFLNILLAADETGLSLFATQHQVSIRRKLQVQLAEAGKVAIPGGLLAEILQALQTVRAETIDFAVSAERRITLTAEGAIYRLAGVDPAGFPAMQEPTGDKSFTIESAKLRELIRRVVVVTSASVGTSFDEVLMEIREGSLALVATDSVRLAVARTAVSTEVPNLDVRLPLNSLSELGKILQGDGDVRVTVGSHQVGFSFAETVYVARTSDKTFPNYRSILPKDHPRYIILESRPFADALKGVSPVARANKHRIRLFAQPGRVRLTCSSPENGGDAERTVDAEMTGDPIELSFNSKYILDFLSVADAEKVKLGVTASALPATFRPLDEAADYIYLLMPINL